MTSFRPIRTISVVVKIFVSLMNEQILEHVNNHVLNENQSGFRKHHSCTTALLRITENMNINKLIIYISLDMKNAFPSVPHDALLKVFASYGLSESAVELIACTLTNFHTQIIICIVFCAIVSNWRVNEILDDNRAIQVPSGDGSLNRKIVHG